MSTQRADAICAKRGGAVEYQAYKQTAPAVLSAPDGSLISLAKGVLNVTSSTVPNSSRSDKPFDPATTYDPQWDRVMDVINALLDSHLLWLHTMPYSEYLQTEHWQDIRQRILERAEYRCELCYSEDNLEVHHKTYVRRGCEKDSDLIALCSRCHERFHDILPREPETPQADATAQPLSESGGSH